MPVRRTSVLLLLAVAFTAAPQLAQAQDTLPDRAAFELFESLSAQVATPNGLDEDQLAQVLSADDSAGTRLELARLLLDTQPELVPPLLRGVTDRLPPDDARRTAVFDLLATAYLRLDRPLEAVGAASDAYIAAETRLGDSNPALLPRLQNLRDLVAEYAPDDLAAIETELSELTKRLQVPEIRRVGKPVAVPVWFGTNRNDTGNSDPSARFGAELADLTLGRLTVTIPPTHRPGRIEQPRSWGLTRHPDPMQHMVLADIEVMAQDLFSTGCCAADDRLLFIHGYNVTFYNGALRAAQLAHDLEFPGQALYYSWPSRGALLGYLTDSNNVLPTRPALVEFLLQATRGTGTLHVIAHSMGNRYFLEAADVLLRDHPERQFGHVVLGAPDVDSNELRVRLDRLGQHAQSVSLYASRNDRALMVSRRIHGAPRAGDSSEGPLRLAGLDTLDASDVVADILGHSYFGDSPLVLGDLAALLRLGLPPAQRCATLERDAPVFDIRPDGCQVNQVLAAIEYQARYANDAIARMSERLSEVEAEEQAFWLGAMEVMTSGLGQQPAD